MPCIPNRATFAFSTTPQNSNHRFHFPTASRLPTRFSVSLASSLAGWRAATASGVCFRADRAFTAPRFSTDLHDPRSPTLFKRAHLLARQRCGNNAHESSRSLSVSSQVPDCVTVRRYAWDIVEDDAHYDRTGGVLTRKSGFGRHGLHPTGLALERRSSETHERCLQVEQELESAEHEQQAWRKPGF